MKVAVMKRRMWRTIPEGMEGRKISCPTDVETNPGGKAMIIQVNQEVYIHNTEDRFIVRDS